MSEVYLREDLQAAWRDRDIFDAAFDLEGEVYRAVATRRTLRTCIDGKVYFAKLHMGVGWDEIFKNLVTLKLPVIGAENEYRACRHLEEHGIQAPRVAAYGRRGGNPARVRSFVITDELAGRESLEDLTNRWFDDPPHPARKRALVMAVAGFARRFHGAGVIHRDFYICHLLLDVKKFTQNVVDLAVLDLHRAQIHTRIPRRWLIRDLAALLFSTLDLPLSRRAWLRFVRVYRARPLREVFAEEGVFWEAVYQRALMLYRKAGKTGLVKGYFDAAG
ncbi:MAG: lipopolysaccharide core heptose(I) kinase RfaP [Proteobacteria bacterium]|nr:lipopolysaccharide core heptose(I) kinase RfaP [Pseudomonadota bacterium]